MSSVSVTKEAEAIHPLLAKTPEKFENFQEWLECWEQARYEDEMMGLLHSLGAKPEWGNDPEVISFLLRTADGHAQYVTTSHEDEYGASKYTARRTSLAGKAFTVLCLIFFRHESIKQPNWWWIVDSSEMFEKVLTFLESERGNCRLLISEERLEHSHRIFNKFLKEFSDLGWDYLYMARQHNDEVHRRMVAARPRFIGILHQINLLMSLLYQQRELDDACLAKLREIAISKKVTLPSGNLEQDTVYRQPATLEEAVLVGSHAAYAVVLYGVSKQVSDRFETLRRIAQKQKELAEQAAQLKSE